MTDHLTTIFEFADQILDLDMVQDWIYNARFIDPTNQLVQLELDRRQAEVNRKRTLIEGMMVDIRSRN